MGTDIMGMEKLRKFSFSRNREEAMDMDMGTGTEALEFQLKRLSVRWRIAEVIQVGADIDMHSAAMAMAMGDIRTEDIVWIQPHWLAQSVITVIRTEAIRMEDPVWIRLHWSAPSAIAGTRMGDTRTGDMV